MSLQVWLPLNGDLRNNGVANVTITNNGATVNDNGKIGKCYNFDGSNDKISINGLNSPKNISIAFWIKRNADTGTRQFLFTAWNGVSIELTTDGRVFGKVYGNGGEHGTALGTKILVSNGWTHITYTFEDKIGGKIYVNGELKQSTASSKSIDWNTTSGNIGFFGSIYLNAKINDFRIYDHALSVKEVKEIFKGLILHYPLNGNGRAGENLLSRYVSCGQNAPRNTSSGARTTYYGDYGIILNGENSDTYFRLFLKEPLEQNEIYTISCVASGVVSGTYYRFPLFVTTNTGMGLLVIDHNGLCKMTFTMTYSTQTPISAGDETVYICFMDESQRNIVSGQGAITLTNFKIEKGNKITPWIPASTDPKYTKMGYDSITEYDTSGNKYNGTKIGTFNYNTDSPRYNVSTIFNSNNYIKNTVYTNLGNLFTMSLWFYMTETSITNILCCSRSVTYGGFMPFIQSGQLKFDPSAVNPSASTRINTNFYPSMNTWYHLVVIKNGTNLTYYVNGEFKQSFTTTAGATYGNTLTIGCRNTDGDIYEDPFIGKISDFRIYATALSADDIKALYNTGASIANNGTLLSNEFIEG